MDREKLLDWIFRKLEEAERKGEIDLEDIDLAAAGITIDTDEGSFRIVVEEI